MKSCRVEVFFCIVLICVSSVCTTPVSKCDFVPNCTCSVVDGNNLNLDCQFDADIAQLTEISTLYIRNSSDIRLYHVSLSHNITKIPANLFKKISVINHLDLSNNAITSLHTINHTEISTLDLSNNAITSLSNVSIHELQVKVLNLTWNDISDIKSTKKTDSVISLYLSHNQIHTISADSFANLPNLRNLDLSNNNIAIIPPNSFSNLPNLHNLDLSNNNIAIIPPNSFSNLPNLHNLDLSNNNIAIIPPNSFSNLPNLLNLDLSNNNITKLSPQSFTSLQYLNSVILSNNKIVKLPALVFATLTSLVTLDISNNELKALMPLQMLTTSHRLTHIDLSNNAIRNLHKDTFTMTRSLTVLKLAHNPLLGLTINNLSLPHTLTHLDLSHSGVTTLNNCGWRMSNLQYLDLTGNSLVCDCGMLWVWEWYEHIIATHPLRESFKTFKCVQRNGDDVPMLSQSPDQLVCARNSRNSTVCSNIYPRFNIKLSVVMNKRTAKVTWKIMSTDNATTSQIFGYRVEITSPKTDISPMLHKFATSYTFDELQDMYDYRFCLAVYKDVKTVLKQKCVSGYVNSLRVLIGVFAGLVFLVPCIVILLCIMRMDKRQKKVRADEIEKQAILSADQELPDSSISVVSVTYL